MAEYLSIAQMKKLQEVLLENLDESHEEKTEISNTEYLQLYLDAKKIEGCSERTLQYYRVTIEKLLLRVISPIRKITTEEIRSYLSEYQKINNCSKVTVDNIRRNISSFFSWLEEEDYILKSPMRRIPKIKTKQPVKEIISDEAIERLRDNCKHPRDRAMIDLLYSTGIRVGELVNLNRDDIDFEARECVVYGKGDKERRVYFDAKAKLHMKEYLESRTDDNPALFVTLDSPYDRLKISGVEIRIRELGKRLHLTKIHPHKFRRTMATSIIDNRRQELQLLNDLIKARFVELFGDAIHNDKGWENDTVEKLCKEIYGGGTPSKSHPEYYEDGDIPWVSSKDMKTDVLTDSQIKINQLGVDNSTARMVPINSVIMVIRSGILKHTLPVAINAVPITVNQDLKIFIPNERVLTRFLAIQFKMHEKDILSGVRAVTADNIEFNSLKQRELIVPPIELQQEYVTFLEQIDKSKVVVASVK